MMNYAEKELREAMAYLDQARALHEAIRAIQRAIELNQPVEVSFRSAEASFTALCPSKADKLLDKLETQAWDRVSNLEKQEVYWCAEVAAVDKQAKINSELWHNSHKSLDSIRAEEKKQEQALAASQQEFSARQQRADA